MRTLTGIIVILGVSSAISSGKEKANSDPMAEAVRTKSAPYTSEICTWATPWSSITRLSSASATFSSK